MQIKPNVDINVTKLTAGYKLRQNMQMIDRATGDMIPDTTCSTQRRKQARKMALVRL